MFVTNYYQRNVINCMLCVVILIPKHSFCNTVCVCMVMQIKLVVVVVVDQAVSVGSMQPQNTTNSFSHWIPPERRTERVSN